MFLLLLISEVAVALDGRRWRPVPTPKTSFEFVLPFQCVAQQRRQSGECCERAGLTLSPRRDKISKDGEIR